MFNFINDENFFTKLSRTTGILSKFYDIPVDCSKIYIRSKYKEIPDILADSIKDFEQFLFYFGAIQQTIYQNFNLDIALDTDIAKLTLKNI
jgi:hypothetical protein